MDPSGAEDKSGSIPEYQSIPEYHAIVVDCCILLLLLKTSESILEYQSIRNHAIVVDCCILLRPTIVL
jgi:hypothetical protein